MSKFSYDLPGSGGGTFASVSVPAVGCATVRDHVFVLPTSNRYAVRWSAIGDPTDFPTPDTNDARTKQAGLQALPNHFGVVTGVVGNDFFAYIFQERAITKASYLGGDEVYSFDTFEEAKGCWRLGRFDRVDDLVFFESEHGYHALEGDVITDIGRGRVDKTYKPAI
jgi:hypothetical protein